MRSYLSTDKGLSCLPSEVLQCIIHSCSIPCMRSLNLTNKFFNIQTVLPLRYCKIEIRTEIDESSAWQSKAYAGDQSDITSDLITTPSLARFAHYVAWTVTATKDGTATTTANNPRSFKADQLWKVLNTMPELRALEITSMQRSFDYRILEGRPANLFAQSIPAEIRLAGVLDPSMVLSILRPTLLS